MAIRYAACAKNRKKTTNELKIARQRKSTIGEQAE